MTIRRAIAQDGRALQEKGTKTTSSIEITDSTTAALWLLSDEVRFVTGLELLVDAGGSTK
ncbi:MULTISPECIES: hypothetical protein [Pseudonocardia]|uniref:hypothetical protein n=1 Tax=Pseudonocardia sp. SID8383 TaxID=2690363 RepID=UPI00091922A0|nr:hypothetical protein [Pseudonocardia sp. SID8383]MYW76375.1 hypothetical protein [Pseudonocardia sp. SID8383]OJG04805.1 hypothetical protein BG618_04168 [Pseudonocardia autotrophica]